MKTTYEVCSRAVVIGLLCAGFQLGVAQAKEKEEFHQTYQLASDGKVQVDNVNGKIHITGWDKDEVKVDAVKTAPSKSELEAVKIEVDSKPDSLRIHTKYPNSHWHWKLWKKSNNANVDYEIKVPMKARLDEVENVNGSVEIEGVRGNVHASTVNGHLEAKGLASEAKLATVNGGVEAVFDKLDGSVSLKTVNGHVELTLPSNVNADVSGSTVNGGIHSDPGLTVKKNWPVGSELHGTLGKGGATVKTETVNGGIRVKLVASTSAKAAEAEDK
jgi:DUF4097 and DUF4098 domain-containing protein YvlB